VAIENIAAAATNSFSPFLTTIGFGGLYSFLMFTVNAHNLSVLYYLIR
jgi:hypothetical protein